MAVRYNFQYKYFKTKVSGYEYIIAVGVDNTFNKNSDLVSVRTNISFYDKEGETFVPAVGVGHNENDALKMCIAEIGHYLSGDNFTPPIPEEEFRTVDLSGLSEEKLPYKFVWVTGKNKSSIVLYKQQANDLIVLTDKKILKLPVKNNILTTLCDNTVKFGKSDTDKVTEEYLKLHGFYPLFETTFKKHGKGD